MQEKDKSKTAESKTWRMKKGQTEETNVCWMEHEKEVGVFGAEEAYVWRSTDGEERGIFQEQK